jgi:hypothetical protein
MIFQQFCHVQFDIVQDIFFRIILEELSILVTFECIWIRTAMSKDYPIIIGSNLCPNKDERNGVLEFETFVLKGTNIQLKLMVTILVLITTSN